MPGTTLRRVVRRSCEAVGAGLSVVADGLRSAVACVGRRPCRVALTPSGRIEFSALPNSIHASMESPSSIWRTAARLKDELVDGRDGVLNKYGDLPSLWPLNLEVMALEAADGIVILSRLVSGSRSRLSMLSLSCWRLAGACFRVAVAPRRQPSDVAAGRRSLAPHLRRGDEEAALRIGGHRLLVAASPSPALLDAARLQHGGRRQPERVGRRHARVRHPVAADDAGAEPAAEPDRQSRPADAVRVRAVLARRDSARHDADRRGDAGGGGGGGGGAGEFVQSAAATLHPCGEASPRRARGGGSRRPHGGDWRRHGCGASRRLHDGARR